MSRFKIKNLRWVIAGLVLLNTIINYVDRQSLSVLAPQLRRSLGMGDVSYGHVVQAFLVAYTGFYIIAGIIIDRWGVKIAYGGAMAWWSVAAMLNALSRSVGELGFFQFLLGVGESFNFIAAQKVAAEWYPPKERALLNGLSNAAAVAGAIITPPLVVFLMHRWNWQMAFVVTGTFGLLWLVPWLLLYDSPSHHPQITEEERAYIRGPEPAPGAAEEPKTRWIDLLRYRETWGLLLSRTVSDPVWWFYLFWLPKYLTESRGMTMKAMSAVIWIPYLASDIGSIMGGWYSGFLVSHNWKILKARNRVLLWSALMMPLGILTVFTRSQVGALACMCVVLFAHMSWKTNLMTLTIDIYPKRVVGSIAGIVALGSGLGAIGFAGIVGWVIKNYSYTPIFIAMGFMHIAAYLIVRLTVRRESLAAIPTLPQGSTHV
ncbi:MAG TPA: MFS transporter [Terriglobales bacterium]|nr:MFS transporter [Terriglobales bacterium]